MDRLIYSLRDGDARRFFEYAGHRARDLREPLRRAGSRLLHHINLTFESEGGWIREDWPQLSRAYAEKKLAAVGEKPMLVYSGRLRRAAIARGAIHTHRDADGGALTYEVDVPYAAAHQYGGWFDYDEHGQARQHPPRRSFVRVTPELVEGIEMDFRLWLEELKAANRARRSIDLPNPFG